MVWRGISVAVPHVRPLWMAFFATQLQGSINPWKYPCTVLSQNALSTFWQRAFANPKGTIALRHHPEAPPNWRPGLVYVVNGRSAHYSMRRNIFDSYVQSPTNSVLIIFFIVQQLNPLCISNWPKWISTSQKKRLFFFIGLFSQNLVITNFTAAMLNFYQCPPPPPPPIG